MARARLKGHPKDLAILGIRNVPGAVTHALHKDIAIIAGLALLAMAAFWPVVTFDFVNYDDHFYLTDNPRVQQGLTPANIGWAFTRAIGYYNPIDQLSHMLDCQLFGMNPGGHHAANLLYHICSTMALFVLLRRMTGQPWCSALAAALFAIHPQNVQPVAWISGRRDVLSTLFALLALSAYLWYAAGPGIRRYVPVVVLLILSMMVKPSFLPFPVVLLFLDYWPLQRMEGIRLSEGNGRRRLCRLVGEKIPLFLIVIAFAVSTYAFQRMAGALTSFEPRPVVFRLANAATSYVMYPWKALWPTHLAACYPYPAFSGWRMAAALSLLALLTVVAVVGRKRFPYLFVGWFWYALILAPLCGLVGQIGNEARADRYAYISTVGLFVAVAWGLDAVVGRWRRTAVVIPVAAVVALAMYAAAANIQVRTWSDSATLFHHAIDAVPDNYLAYTFFGKTLEEQGRDDDAIAAYSEALHIAPGFADAHNNLGSVLNRKGRYAEAVGHYAAALSARPRDPIMLYNMGLALLAQDKVDDAIAHFRQAIAAQPDLSPAHNSLGYSLARKGAPEEAVAEYRKALAAAPDSPLVLYNMGDALVALGRHAEALQCYTHAGEADPGNRHEALNRIGEALVRQDKNEEAIPYFRQAVAAKPDFAVAHNNLGCELARKGALKEAIAEYRQALRIDPNFTLALNNLKRALADLGGPGHAAPKPATSPPRP